MERHREGKVLWTVQKNLPKCPLIFTERPMTNINGKMYENCAQCFRVSALLRALPTDHFLRR